MGPNSLRNPDGACGLISNESIWLIPLQENKDQRIRLRSRRTRLPSRCPGALQKQHWYQYPDGMDDACNDYVKQGWCFVAVKTKVGQKKGVDSKPGMRKVDSKLPDGSTFDGNVQAMGFRFKVKQLVVPMRLSTFNAGDLHNIVYILSDKPQKIRSVPEEYVVRQISGEQLLKNVTQPLPLRIIGGTVKDLQPFQKNNLKQRRDPSPHNGAAKDLFAADLLAVKEGRLTHPHEEVEKMLLAVGERLNLRGPEIDKLNEASLKAERDETVKQGLEDLKGMTLSVVDGNFPREILASRNLTFSRYKMSSRRNKREFYDAKTLKPAPAQPGVIHYGVVSLLPPTRPVIAARRPYTSPTGKWSVGLLMVSSLIVGLTLVVRRRRAS